MKRTVTITQNPKVELALRELESMIASVSATSVTVTGDNETIVVTSSNHNMGIESGVYVDTDGGSRTVYLSASPVKGRLYKVGNRGSNSVIVNGVGRKINGDVTAIILNEFSTMQLQYSGIEWMII